MPKKEEFKVLEDENEKLNKQIHEFLEKIGQAEEQMEVFMIKYGRVI